MHHVGHLPRITYYCYNSETYEVAMGRTCTCDKMSKNCSLENVSEMAIQKTNNDLEDRHNCLRSGLSLIYSVKI